MNVPILFKYETVQMFLDESNSKIIKFSFQFQITNPDFQEIFDFDFCSLLFYERSKYYRRSCNFIILLISVKLGKHYW